MRIDILINGPKGSGKSTVMAKMMKLLQKEGFTCRIGKSDFDCDLEVMFATKNDKAKTKKQ